MNRREFSLMSLLLLVIGAVICVTPPPAARAAADPGAALRWRVRLAALTPQGQIKVMASAQVISWTSSGRIKLSAAGKTVNLTTRDLLSLRRSIPGAAEKGSQRSPWWLHLRTGDILAGTPMAASGGKMTFDSAVFGKLTVPIDDVAGLTRKRTTPPLQGIAHDHVQFINGDQLSGAMLRLLPQAVQWKSTLGTIRIPLAHIKRINLAETVVPRAIHGPRIRMTFMDGTMVTASAITWRGPSLVLPGPAIKPMSCGVAMLKRIDILDGHIMWLTALAPQKYVQIPYVGIPWRLAKNLSCVLRKLDVNGRGFRHGLGTHVAAQLIYNLADKYNQMTFIPAMDRSARPWGSCQVVVQGDGKTLYTSGVIRCGELLPPVLLSVRHVKILNFIVSGTQAYGVRGRVDILNAALVR